jgi:hypothetical protein
LNIVLAVSESREIFILTVENSELIFKNTVKLNDCKELSLNNLKDVYDSSLSYEVYNSFIEVVITKESSENLKLFLYIYCSDKSIKEIELN